MASSETPFSGPGQSNPVPGLTRAELKTPRSAAIAGIIFAVFFTASIWMLHDLASVEAVELSGLLEGSLRANGSLVASYLVPFAGIAFLWFIGVVRDRIGASEDRLFATVFLGSGLLFIAMLFGAAAVLAAALVLETPTPATVELARAIARTMLYVFGARAAGVFTIVTSAIVVRTGAAARPIALAGYAVGLALLLSVRWFDLIILFFPAWVAVLSVAILISTRADRRATA